MLATYLVYYTRLFVALVALFRYDSNRRIVERIGTAAQIVHCLGRSQLVQLNWSSKMAQSQKPAGRKPATKFAHLRKKMDQAKVRPKMPTQHVRKSGNR
jgi:hypothetical protein